MKNDTKPTDNLQLIIEKQDQKIAELEALVKWYEEQFRLAKHRQFGQSSEKTQPSDQIGLFDEAETTADRKNPEPELEEITHTRKKRKGKREEDLSGLPVNTVEHELPEDERVCGECGGALHSMGKETRRELTIVPAQVSVTEHVRHVYSCRNCEKTADSVPIVKASMPEPVIKGSIASPTAIAHIMTQKYVTYTPLYRQEAEFIRQGISLSRQTMANWIIKASEDWLEPIYERLRLRLLEHDVLHADETVLQVLQEPGRKANTESYMWLYRTSGDAKHPIAMYEYQPTRSSSHPKRFLSGWSGYLHTDGYSAYHTLVGVTVVGCWAHMRRRFDEALKSMKPEERFCSNAQKGLEYCNRLFRLESEAFADLPPDELHERRKEQSRPIAEEFFAWAQKLNVLPKTQIGKAITYAIGQQEWLMNVYLDGRLELSNNRAERSIKPFVMGRKNWLFCNTQNGARASSVIYSIIETAKENGLKPFEYLKFLFEIMPNTTTANIENLLPWSDILPKCCMVGK